MLSSGSKIFVVLNPATHKFYLSQLNKVTGKIFSPIEKKEKNKINTHLLKAMPHSLKN